VLLTLFLVACVLPVGGLAIRYLTYETGPYRDLPDVCTAIDNDALRQLIGDAQGQHQRDDDETVAAQDSCQWGPGSPKTTVNVSAQRSTRRWNASSVDRATVSYGIRLWWVRGGDLQGSYHVDGAQEGVCRAWYGDESTVDYRCAARDGNVVISVQVIAPMVGRATTRQLLDSTKAFAAGPGKALIADLVADLRPARSGKLTP
jgi:hypothetical protein